MEQRHAEQAAQRQEREAIRVTEGKGMSKERAARIANSRALRAGAASSPERAAERARSRAAPPHRRRLPGERAGRLPPGGPDPTVNGVNPGPAGAEAGP